MKKTILTFSSLILFLSLIYVGCDNYGKDLFAKKAEESITIGSKKLTPCGTEKTAFPEGTIFKKTDQGIDFKLPDGYYLETKAPDQLFDLDPQTEGSVSCDCTEPTNGKCYPVEFTSDGKKFIACVTEPGQTQCKTCVMKTTSNVEIEGNYKTEIKIGDINKARKVAEIYKKGSGDVGLGLLALGKALVEESNVKITSSYTEITSLPPVNDQILASKEVKDELQAIITNLNESGKTSYLGSDGTIPKGYKLVPLNIQDHIGYILLSEEDIAKNDITALATEENVARCSGSCGSGRCTLRQKSIPLLGTIYLCEGCNDGCTLHF